MSETITFWFFNFMKLLFIAGVLLFVISLWKLKNLKEDEDKKAIKFAIFSAIYSIIIGTIFLTFGMKKIEKQENEGFVAFIISIITFVAVFIYYENILVGKGLLIDLQASIYSAFISLIVMLIVEIFFKLTPFLKDLVKFLKTLGYETYNLIYNLTYCIRLIMKKE